MQNFEFDKILGQIAIAYSLPLSFWFAGLLKNQKVFKFSCRFSSLLSKLRWTKIEVENVVLKIIFSFDLDQKMNYIKIDFFGLKLMR